MQSYEIFPARAMPGMKSVVSQGSILFEIYATGEEEGYTKAGKVMLDGKEWNKYTKSMSLDEYTEFCTSREIFGREDPGQLPESTFAKFNGPASMPKVMGIANITPDSFFPGSRMPVFSTDSIDRVLLEKPDIIDIGGESTRPGSSRLSPNEEIERIRPYLDYVSTSYDIPISLDTRNPETAEFALQYGISYINDVSGFRDKEMVRIAAENSLNCILMHMRGEPETMQQDTSYTDIILELNRYFSAQAETLLSSGIDGSRIIIDPGIGFGKGLSGNLEIMKNLHCFFRGFQVLVGASRKSFIGKITGESVEDRLPGTIATSIYLMSKKADIVRVHDVRENRAALQVYSALNPD